MRYIQKKNSCEEFQNYILNNKLQDYLHEYIENENTRIHPWNKLSENKEGDITKRKLAHHLFNEQKGLCIYCQQQLNPQNKDLSNFAHIEHIKPKERNSFPQFTFEHFNLTVSCNGFNNEVYSTDREFCGHKKGSRYNEDLFLNPIEKEDIENYFEYSIEGKIRPAKILNEYEKTQVEYMIKLLDLQNSELQTMRANSYLTILEFEDSEITELLSVENEMLPGFYSMLKQLFSI